MSLETLHEVRCLAQELVIAEGLDAETAMTKAINLLPSLHAYQAEWDSFVATLIAQQVVSAA